MKGDDYWTQSQTLSPTGYKYNKKARCLLTVRKSFVEGSETALIYFNQSINQSLSQNPGPITSAETHYNTDSIHAHMSDLLCNLFHFTALSRLNKLRLGASMAQSVQRLRYGLNCLGFESNRRRDTFLQNVQLGCGAQSASYSLGTASRAAGS